MVPFLAALVLLSTSAPDPAEIVRKSALLDEENFNRGRNYIYRQQAVERELDKAGNTTAVNTTTSERIIIHGRRVMRLIERDGKPLPPREAEKERERIDKLERKWGRESEAERQRYLAKEEEERREAREFFREIPNAYTFRLAGEERLNGRDAWVIDAEPRSDFRPRVSRAKLLSKFRGRLWIDKRDYQWVKAECETIDTVSFGWFLARLNRGARLSFEQLRINDEIWLPRRMWIRMDARLGLLKAFRRDMELINSDFRKFQSDSTVTLVGESAR